MLKHCQGIDDYDDDTNVTEEVRMRKFPIILPSSDMQHQRHEVPLPQMITHLYSS